MRATRGPAPLLFVIFGIGLLLTGCTDNTGAIDQAGHNGFDRMACTNFATMANEVKHNAMTVTDAKTEADKLAATTAGAGDPMVRQAGSRLAAAYKVADPKAVAAAILQFQSACKW
jgi:hypothetical protein